MLRNSIGDESQVIVVHLLQLYRSIAAVLRRADQGRVHREVHGSISPTDHPMYSAIFSRRVLKIQARF